eukprot:2965249-Alexandrium_andersonii.AAC.1
MCIRDSPGVARLPVFSAAVVSGGVEGGVLRGVRGAEGAVGGCVRPVADPLCLSPSTWLREGRFPSIMC